MVLQAQWLHNCWRPTVHPNLHLAHGLHLFWSSTSRSYGSHPFTATSLHRQASLRGHYCFISPLLWPNRSMMLLSLAEGVQYFKRIAFQPSLWFTLLPKQHLEPRLQSDSSDKFRITHAASAPSLRYSALSYPSTTAERARTATNQVCWVFFWNTPTILASPPSISPPQGDIPNVDICSAWKANSQGFSASEYHSPTFRKVILQPLGILASRKEWTFFFLFEVELMRHRSVTWKSINLPLQYWLSAWRQQAPSIPFCRQWPAPHVRFIPGILLKSGAYALCTSSICFTGPRETETRKIYSSLIIMERPRNQIFYECLHVSHNMVEVSWSFCFGFQRSFKLKES